MEWGKVYRNFTRATRMSTHTRTSPTTDTRGTKFHNAFTKSHNYTHHIEIAHKTSHALFNS